MTVLFRALFLVETIFSVSLVIPPLFIMMDPFRGSHTVYRGGGDA